MKAFMALFLGVLISVNGIAADFISKQKSVSTIWPEIIFAQGADFNNFNHTITQTRDRVRKKLWQDFSDTAIPMVMSGADAASLAPVLADILLAFEQMYQVHRKDAFEGISQSLDVIFRSAFEQQFTRYAIPENQRKVIFSKNADLSSAVEKSAGRGLGVAPSLQAMREVDYLLSGVVSVLPGGNVNISLNLENYRTGETRAFSSVGRIQYAIEDLAMKVFDFFQSNQFEEWKNPQPKLQWIPAAPGSQKDVLAGTAQMICQSQGARMPYARELILAAASSPYQPGGIPALGEHEVYVVADHQRHNKQHYYFTYRQQEPGGPVRTDAGYGAILAKYWCVKGEISDDIRRIENFYALLRKTQDPEVTNAVEYILCQINDFGAKPKYQDMFSDMDAAEELLRAKGIWL